MNSRRKKVRKKKHFKEYGRDYIKLLLFLCFFLYISRKPLLYSWILNSYDTEITYAYVIDEKNYERRGHLADKFTYSYEFIYNGTTYTENSYIRGLTVGNRIRIEFNKKFPFINRIIK